MQKTKFIQDKLTDFINVIKNNQKLNKKELTKALKAAIFLDNSESAKLLIEQGIDLQNEEENILLLPLLRKQYKMIEVLLENNVNHHLVIEDQAVSLFEYIDIVNDIKLSKIIIKYFGKQEFVISVVLENKLDRLEFLLNHGLDPNEKINGTSLLLFAIIFDKTDIAKLLIEKGADVNEKINGTSLLLFAIIFDKTDIAKLLIENGNGINFEKDKDMPYLAYVIAFNNQELAEYFIQNEFQKISDFDLLSSLLLNGSQQFIKDLFDKDINTQDEDNNSFVTSLLLDIDDDEKSIEKILLNSFYQNQSIIHDANIKIFEIQKQIENLILDDREKNIHQLLTKLSNFINIKLSNIIYQVQEKFKNKLDPIVLTQRFIDHGGDINIKNNRNQTALSIAYEKNLMNVVKLLINNGADVNVELDNGDSLYDRVKHLQQIELMKLLEKSPTFLKPNNKPKDLVKLLTFFTLDTPLKCTTHAWEGSCENKDGLSFDAFISKVQIQWDGIKNELQELSPNLYQKIESFLFKNIDDATVWSEEKELKLGWSSVDGLKEHINEGKRPFEFVLKEPIKTHNQTITTFGELISLFKEEIEVRNDSSMLESVFESFETELNDNDMACDIDSSAKGIDFYTDVEKFRNALVIIFKQFIVFHSHNNELDEVSIKVVKPEDSQAQFIEIYITHLHSSSHRTAQELLAEVKDGDFKQVQEELQNLCDWSVLDSYDNVAYKINYLKSNNIKDIEQDSLPIFDGFTHILRFYK